MNFKTTNLIILSWLLEILNKQQEVSERREREQVEESGSAGSEAKRTLPNDIDFAVGGQAVIEGVMMRSPSNITIAVRKQDNSIKVTNRDYIPLTKRIKALNIFIVRGVVNLFEMMGIGAKAINYSANESLEDPEDIKRNTHQEVGKTILNRVGEIVMFIISLVLAIGLSLALFKGLPLLVATYFEGTSTYVEQNYILFNLIDGLAKITIFLSYIFILSLIPSFKRIFEYHGAEHKSIFAYENKLELTVPNAKKQSRFHPRCGTSFILVVFVISIIVYTFIPKQDTFMANLGLRVLALPFIAGISYEYLKLSAKFVENPFVKLLVAPGLWLQRLTTKEPDNSQLEVGLKSLAESLAAEKKA